MFDGTLNGMDWWWIAGGVVVGLVVGWSVALSTSFLVGYLRERGRIRAAADAAQGAEKDQQRRADAEREAQRVAKVAAQVEHSRTIEGLRAERVGSHFIRRSTRTDPGIAVTVIDLCDRDPLRRVIVREEHLPGRSPTEYDGPDLLERLSIDWTNLVQAPAAQRHHTARLMAESHDDRDGWLLFERVI